MLRSFTAFVCALGLCAPALSHDDFPHWVTLFDGRTNDGWVHAKGDSPKPCSWKVEDGALTNGKDGPHGGVDACTVEELEDYVLEIEFRSLPTGHGNSGVYLRGQVEVQIFNSTFAKGKDGKLEAHDGGAIYAVGPPLVNAHKPQGEWNRYTILHIGDTISVWLNGVPVQKGAKQAEPTPGSIGKHPVTDKPLASTKGPLMLQGDHDQMWFRNIRALKIPKGWKPVFNGLSLDEIRIGGDGKAADQWQLEELGFGNWKGGNRDAWTKAAYGNFLVHYEYRARGNAGFYLRDQWELQIYNKQSTDEKHSDGSFYDRKPPEKIASNGGGEWNAMDVKLVQNKAWVWQNDTLIHDGYELTRRTDADRETKVFSRAPFKFQGDHGPVSFRYLFIKELPDDAKP